MFSVSWDNKVYIISNKTQAILFEKDSAYYQSTVVEFGNNRKKFAYPPEKIVEQSCVVYGATLKRRRMEAEGILQSKTKLPIQIIPENNIYMFPTAAARSKVGMWLAYYHIRGIESRFDKTYVLFKDGTGLYVNVSEESLRAQYVRTGHLVAQQNQNRFFGTDLSPWYT